MIAAAVAVLAHPGLWPTAVRQMRRLARPAWWRRAPFLPLPDKGYLSFRMSTQYGSTETRFEAADVLSYLRWCREWRLGGG